MKQLQANYISGSLRAMASKSCLHRALFCAAAAQGESMLCGKFRYGADCGATIQALQALGAAIRVGDEEIRVQPMRLSDTQPVLHCANSGTTARFLAPFAAVHYPAFTLHAGEQLAGRPMRHLLEQLRLHGCRIASDGFPLICRGKLQSGAYTLPGNVSSQYVSALLLSLPLLAEESSLCLLGAPESAGYIELTQEILLRFGVTSNNEELHYGIPGGQKPKLSAPLSIEGDWSQAAVWLCAAAIAGEITVSGLRQDSRQADRAVAEILSRMGARVTYPEQESCRVQAGELRAIDLDAAQMPDLVPVLAVVCAAAAGESRIRGCARLRLKESDRLTNTAQLLQALGGDVCIENETLVIRGGRRLKGTTVSSCGDHRLAMAAAIASLLCASPVTVTGSDAVEKSDPDFWESYQNLVKE